MKNNKYFKFFGVFIAILSLTSCVKDDEDYDSSISSRPNVTVPVTSYTVTEGDDVLVTMVADKPYRTSLDFNLEVLSDGTALELDDFAVNLNPTVLGNDPWNGIKGYIVSFPAYTTSYTFSISTILDALPEGTENVSLKLTMSGNHNGNLDEASRVLNIAIANGVQSSLDLVLDWDQTFNLSGTDYTLCDIVYDNDFYVVDGATEVDNAATADCPESISMDLADYPNGNYDIYQNLYDDGGLSGAGVSPAFSIPVKVHYYRGGSTTLDGTYTQDPAYAVDSNTLPDPSGATLYYVVTVNVQDGVFTLFDDNGNIASGRMAKAKKAIKSFIANDKAKKSITRKIKF
jgi:hypothetical protein